MKHYVLGFFFSNDCRWVKLINKKRPAWQKGFCNGIGGHIEPEDETPVHAMVREFEEETGFRVEGWEHMFTFICRGGTVFVYKNVAKDPKHFAQPTTTTDEYLETCAVCNILDLPVMSNLKWMIPMMLDDLKFPILMEYQNLCGCEQLTNAKDSEVE